MKAAASWILAASLLLLLLSSAKAFSILAGRPYLSSQMRHTFFLDDDFVSNMVWTGTNRSPTNQEMLNRLDQVAQYWSMFGRGDISIRINPTTAGIANVSCAATPQNCGVLNPPGQSRHEITHGPTPWWWTNGSVALATCWSTSDCDVYVPNQTALAALSDFLNTDATTSGNAASMIRIVGHEIGHLLGIAHPTPQNEKCSSQQESPLMCQIGLNPSIAGVGTKWDFPAQDDIQAVNFLHGTATNEVRISQSQINSTGTMAPWGAVSIDGMGGPNFVVQPRIACRPNSDAPDCVVATTTPNGCPGGLPGCISLTSISKAVSGAAWAAVNSTKWSAFSNHQVDVAFAANTPGTSPSFAHAVTVQMGDPDRNIKWARWNLQSGSAPTNSGTLAFTGGLAGFQGGLPVTHAPPRIAWHHGVSRCIIAYSDHLRNFNIAISTDKNCVGFEAAYRLTYPGGINEVHHATGPFDLACPLHEKAPSSLNASDPCVIVFSEQTSVNGAGATPAQITSALNLNMASCAFTISTAGVPSASVANCSFSSWADTVQVSVSNGRYGTSPSPAYLTSVSRKFPASNDNTAQILFNGPSFAQSLSLSMFNNPLSGNSRYDWGGLSCDFVEYNQSLACVGFDPGTGGTAW